MSLSENRVEAIVGMIRGGRIQEARKTLRETIREQPRWAADWYLFARLLMEGSEREDRLRSVPEDHSTAPQAERAPPSSAAGTASLPAKAGGGDKLTAERLTRLEGFLSGVRRWSEVVQKEGEPPPERQPDPGLLANGTVERLRRFSSQVALLDGRGGERGR